MKGATLWFTGLSGAGKTTVSRLVAQKLRARGGVAFEVLDGDELRAHVTAGAGFARADRGLNVRIAAYLAGMLNRHGVLVLASFISPYRADRDACRQSISQFVEIYVRCSLDVCIRRDVKGLYRKALDGSLQAFTGISDPYEAPLAPELVLDTERESVEESADKVIAYLEQRGYV
ncbi:adenylyl-sulfate kinase [Paenibacillus sp. IB182496]|uniref:Adenylyl-sulfate kinase n=1 Tax=Paenibacillus sabuli TaxID=2772509 RepID=A0A927BW36_9BACL|nr:adenylyl-sulfate kinase [Paenibacillus sabuli]MBD2846428.1 adenylyl-sulfate kinase [Paenibacillus sabuli]